MPAALPPELAADTAPLRSRAVLITGATSGLGRALALRCAAAGAQVILCGRNQRRLEALYDQIEAAGGPQPAMAVLDLASATAVDYDALASVVEREFGRLDGLVHAAGLLGDRTPLEQYDVPTWCKVLHINLTAPFILTQVLLPALKKSDAASVVFVSSGVVKQARPYWGAYAVAKSGQEALRAMWAEEAVPVRMNSVNPGRMRTPMRAAAYPAEDPNTVPSPDSVAGMFLYLLSPHSRAIDGQFLDAQ
jgi:NAD(P)-dependent dehydrogenase (short-subunit alcohol dehydrogenase family)